MKHCLLLLFLCAAGSGLRAQPSAPGTPADTAIGARPQCPAPAIDLGPDRIICANDSVVLDAGAGFSSYLWSTGETTRTIAAKQVGRYLVTATTPGGCVATDEFEIIRTNPAPQVQLDQRPYVCPGSSRILDAGTFASYRWHDGSTGRVFVVMTAGLVSVEVTDFNGCKGTGSVQLIPSPDIPQIALPADTTLCQYQQLVLKAPPNFHAYRWSTGSTGATLRIPGAGLYWLEVASEQGCTSRDSIRIDIKQCNRYFFVPTAFTPNGDGRNDRFRPLLDGNLLSYQFAIFDRWGRIVFESKDPRRGWDGKLAAQEQGSNVYVWTCSFHLEGGPPETRKGTFTVMR
ncbi:gliding motility-associated C-terminal domain-containing protein [Flaviaesturariibacter amylovorans]